MAKGTPVEAIPREAIPEDLSGVRWTVLQKTAHTLGIPLGQKRPQLEDAIHMALGRAVTAPLGDPAGEAGEAGPVGDPDIQDELDDLQADDEQVQVPAFDVGALPDVGVGEAPPEDPLPRAPVSAPEPEPAPVAAPVRPTVAAVPESDTWWLDDEKAGVQPEPYTGERFPEPPVNYLSRNAELRIQIKSAGQSGNDKEGFWQQGRPGEALQFGPKGDNPLFQCRVTTRARVKAMETSGKFKRGVVWRERDDALRAVADARRHLAIVEAQARGDKATLAELLATQPQVLEGSRSTRNEPNPEGVAAMVEEGFFPGQSALLNDAGRFGMAFRDGIRTAQARGEV